MTAHEPPSAPEVEKAYRDAHRALERILPPDFFVPEKDLRISDVISQLWSMVNKAELAAVAQGTRQPYGRTLALPRDHAAPCGSWACLQLSAADPRTAQRSPAR